MLKRHVMPQADHYVSFPQIYTFNSSICKKMSAASLSTCRMARRYHKYILYVDFVLHSHSKVNCGKKQIIIVSVNSTPKYQFLTPYFPIRTQFTKNVFGRCIYIYIYYPFGYNIIQVT